MNRSEKAAVIEAIKARAEKAPFTVLTDFKGMSVEELTNLRVSLRKAGGEYHVVKNTLARIALTDGTHAAIKDKFHDNCGVAFGYDDPVAVAKALSDFAKQSKLFELRCAQPGRQGAGRRPDRRSGQAARQGTASGSAARHHERRAHQFCVAVCQPAAWPALRPQGY